MNLKPESKPRCVTHGETKMESKLQPSSKFGAKVRHNSQRRVHQTPLGFATVRFTHSIYDVKRFSFSVQGKNAYVLYTYSYKAFDMICIRTYVGTVHEMRYSRYTEMKLYCQSKSGILS